MMVFNLESIFTNQGFWSMALELDLSGKVHITGWRVNPSAEKLDKLAASSSADCKQLCEC
ncbi:hypothetical protein BDE02_08G009200 [Populus trichocarpa]|nr:hypothetical protein BDE02_08G009200 [Populus trichocarpa]